MKRNSTIVQVASLFIVGAIVISSCDNDNDVNPTGNVNPIVSFINGGDTTLVFNFEPKIRQIFEYNTPWKSKGRGGCGCDNCVGTWWKIDLESGETLGNDPTDDIADWDIAVRGTTIIVNGGEPLGYIDEPQRTGNVSAYLIQVGDTLSLQVGDTVQNSVITAEDVATVDLDSIRAIQVSNLLMDGWIEDPEDDCLLLGAIGSLTQKTNLADPGGSISGSTHPFLPLEQIYVIRTRNGNYAFFKLLSTYKGFESVQEDFNTFWLGLIDEYTDYQQKIDDCNEDEDCVASVEAEGWTGWPAGSHISFEYAYFDLAAQETN